MTADLETKLASGPASGLASGLESMARGLVAPGKGILAADESFSTIGKRFAPLGIDNSEDNRRAYRQMLFTTPGAAEFVSGVILFDETLRQRLDDGTPMPQFLERIGVVPGIKVDKGTQPLAGCPGESITEGLDGLRGRLAEYRELGARFAKWRAVLDIGDLAAGLPSAACIGANAEALGRYAALCQEQGLVPIVEPEVLMDGAHDLARCAAVTEEVLRTVFAALARHRVALEGMLLKPNMVISGKKCPHQAGVEDVARATVLCLRRTVPGAVPGVVFLSGGQSDEVATAHLDAMNRLGPHPWELSFSYGRALQQPALKAWSGQRERVAAGQHAFHHRARCNGAARYGRWTEALERESPSVG
jgi:fructose-bisphosphate aldolase class I